LWGTGLLLWSAAGLAKEADDGKEILALGSSSVVVETFFVKRVG
jgi:hypothetical protein